jgi:hypothetical protein
MSRRKLRKLHKALARIDEETAWFNSVEQDGVGVVRKNAMRLAK